MFSSRPLDRERQHAKHRQRSSDETLASVNEVLEGPPSPPSFSPEKKSSVEVWIQGIESPDDTVEGDVGWDMKLGETGEERFYAVVLWLLQAYCRPGNWDGAQSITILETWL